MSHVVYRIIPTDCPLCGQSSPKVVRRLQDRVLAANHERLAEECMGCYLQRQNPVTRGYYIRTWRMMWTQAGGKSHDLPACLRLPNDPLPPPPPPTRPPKPIHSKIGSGPRKPVQDGWKPARRVKDFATKAAARPRVLWCLHSLAREGSQRVVLHLLQHLRGMDHTVFALTGGPLAEELSLSGVPRTLLFTPANFDLVVMNTVATHQLIAKCKDPQVRPLWLIHEQSPEPFLSASSFTEVSQWARRIVFVHPSQKKDWEAFHQQPALVIPTAIPPTGPMDKSSARTRLGVKDGVFLAVTMGRDEPRKGQKDIRDAVSGLNIRMEYLHGRADGRDWLSAADCYIASSRWEGYPIAVQEAKACRLPVIATDIAPHRDLIQDGENGLLYTPGDTAALASHIIRLQGNPDEAARMGAVPAGGAKWEETLLSFERLLVAETGGGTAAQEELHVVYHIASMGDFWREVVSEQLGQLAKVGLTRVFCTHVGEGLDWCFDEAAKRGIELVCTFHDTRLTHYERPAIELIERLAHASNKPILYIHSKGVSHPKDDVFWQEWRRLLMDALLPDWRQHVRALDSYDAVGCNWWTQAGKWHFSGNFWMAHPRWLRQLPAFSGFYRDRFSCEVWIGAVEGCNAKSLICQDARFWQQDRDFFWQCRKEQLERLKGQQ